MLNIYHLSKTGTIFQEVWKRKTARLAYEWDVDEYEDTEPDRPEFYGTKERPVSWPAACDNNYNRGQEHQHCYNSQMFKLPNFVTLSILQISKCCEACM